MIAIGSFAWTLWDLIFGSEIKKELARRERAAKKAAKLAAAAKRREQAARAQAEAAAALLAKLEAEALRREQSAEWRRLRWHAYLAEQGITPAPLDPNPYDDPPPGASDR